MSSVKSSNFETVRTQVPEDVSAELIKQTLAECGDDPIEAIVKLCNITVKEPKNTVVDTHVGITEARKVFDAKDTVYNEVFQEAMYQRMMAEAANVTEKTTDSA
jgi:hypothetical protein